LDFTFVFFLVYHWP